MNDVKEVSKLNAHLVLEFEGKDLGPLRYLGLRFSDLIRAFLSLKISTFIFLKKQVR